MAPRSDSFASHTRSRKTHYRFAVTISLAVALLATGVGPAAAQEGETPTAASDSPSPEVTSVEGTPVEGASVEDPLLVEDPLSGEAPGEEAPAVDITVPPKETYGGQEEFKPAEILWSSVTAAQRKLDENKAAKETAIGDVHRLRKRAKELAVGKRALDSESQAIIDELAEASIRLQNRAVAGYQRFGSGSDSASESSVANYQEVIGVQRRSKMVGSALDVGELDLDRLDTLRASLDIDALALVDRLRVVSDSLSDAEAKVEEIDIVLAQAIIEFEAFRAGSEIFIHGVVFPIAGEHGAPFDSYGFPRMPGTPDEHWHEGIDLFAERGTPLVATERGVITKLGSGRLGGLKFWLKGESGSEWYYAHLDSFAPGLADGVVVEAGQLVGYVGNTGNAVSTPPHLHMQLHPDGGEPVNPYPLLTVVSEMERLERESGGISGYTYDSFVVDRPDSNPDAEPELEDESDPESEPDGSDPEADQQEPTSTTAPDAVPVDGSEQTSTTAADTSSPDTATPDSGAPDVTVTETETPDPDTTDAAPPDEPTVEAEAADQGGQQGQADDVEVPAADGDVTEGDGTSG